MKYNYLHPYTLLIILKKFLGIIAIPIISQILWYFLSEYKFIRNPIYFNVVIISLVFVIVLVQYLNQGIKITGNKIRFKKGVIRKKVFSISLSEINLIKLDFNIINKCLGSYRLRIAKPITNIPITEGFYVNKKIMNYFISKRLKDQNFKIIKVNSLFFSFILSLFWLNPVNILFICLPFINKANKLLNTSIKQKIYSTLDVRIYSIALGIPPIIASVILITLLFIVISTFINFLQYGNFTLKDNMKFFYTESGILIKRKNFIEKSGINAVSVKYSLLMKLFKIGSIYYHVDKPKKLKNDNLLLLGDKYKNCLSLLETLRYPINADCKIKFSSKSIKGFIFLPLCIIMLNLSVMILCRANGYSKITITLLQLSIIYLIWWLIIKIFAYKNTSISIINKESIIIRGYRGMFFIETFIMSDKIKNIVIRQNIFQRYFNTCNIYFYLSPNSEDLFFAKNLDYQQVNKFLHLINMNI